MVPMPPPSSSSSNKANDSSSAAAAAGSSDGGQDGSNGVAGSSGSNGVGVDASADDFGGFLPLQLAELATPGEMASASKPNMPLEQVQVGGVCCLLGAGWVLLSWCVCVCVLSLKGWLGVEDLQGREGRKRQPSRLTAFSPQAGAGEVAGLSETHWVLLVFSSSCLLPRSIPQTQTMPLLYTHTLLTSPIFSPFSCVCTPPCPPAPSPPLPPPHQMLSMLAGKDPAMLHMLGINPGMLAAQLARHKAAATWGVMTQHGERSLLGRRGGGEGQGGA